MDILSLFVILHSWCRPIFPLTEPHRSPADALQKTTIPPHRTAIAPPDEVAPDDFLRPPRRTVISQYEYPPRTFKTDKTLRIPSGTNSLLGMDSIWAVLPDSVFASRCICLKFTYFARLLLRGPLRFPAFSLPCKFRPAFLSDYGTEYAESCVV